MPRRNDNAIRGGRTKSKPIKTVGGQPVGKKVPRPANQRGVRSAVRKG